MKKLLSLVLVFVFLTGICSAADMVGTGYGGSREESRAEAVYDLKSQIMIEQSSTLEIRSKDDGTTSSDSLSLLITEYSRVLALEGVQYTDTEDNTKEFGQNWYSVATIPADFDSVYAQKVESLYSEIVTLDQQIQDDTGSVKNSTWQKTLLDLCYDFLSYRIIAQRLNSSANVPELPLSISKVKLEYEDMLVKEKNSIGTDLTSLLLRYANGDLDEAGLLELEEKRLSYSNTVDLIGQIGTSGIEAKTFYTYDFSGTEPVTVSDFVLAIEGNRKAFKYYQSASNAFQSRLLTLSEATMKYIDTMSRKSFTSVSDSDELAFEILKYSDVYEGWIARATMTLGDQTLQFSFVIPFLAATGTTFNQSTFEAWNARLMEDAEETLQLRIGYELRGEYIGNEYRFKITSLEVLNKGTGKVVHTANLSNPITIVFAYGTEVDLGNVGGSDQVAQQARIKANSETGFSNQMDIYAEADVDYGYAFTLGNGNTNDYLSGAKVWVEGGVVFQNGEEGQKKVYTGFGLRIGYSFLDSLLVKNKSTGAKISETQIKSSLVIGASAYQMSPLDATLKNLFSYGIFAGYAIQHSSFLVNLNVKVHSIMSDNLQVYYGAGITAQFYDSKIFIGVAPVAGVRFQF